MIMGLIWEILKASAEIEEEKEKKKRADLEKEMDAYDLEDWQKRFSS